MGNPLLISGHGGSFTTLPKIMPPISKDIPVWPFILLYTKLMATETALCVFKGQSLMASHMDIDGHKGGSIMLPNVLQCGYISPVLAISLKPQITLW